MCIYLSFKIILQELLRLYGSKVQVPVETNLNSSKINECFIFDCQTFCNKPIKPIKAVNVLGLAMLFLKHCVQIVWLKVLSLQRCLIQTPYDRI